MYESTGVCPFINSCSASLNRARIEERLLRDKRTFLTEKTWSSLREFNRILEEYIKQQENIQRASGRCYTKFKQCLKYWQLMKDTRREKKIEPPMKPMISENQQIHESKYDFTNSLV
jgi:hypothetical protein